MLWYDIHNSQYLPQISYIMYENILDYQSLFESILDFRTMNESLRYEIN